jgi:predicted transcriptional regulator
MNELASVDTNASPEAVQLTADIVSAYVSNNPVGAGDLPKLIAEVHASLRALSGAVQDETPAELKPAVSIRKSVTPDFLICLEDGKKFKSLKRHISTHYDLTPDQYRQKWNLPADYPMVAPNYSAVRSGLAKSNGLGRKTAEPVKVKAPRRRVPQAAE